MEVGEIAEIILEANDLIGCLFSEIRPWTPEAVDNERLTWLRCYGVPCHAWSLKFFDFITCSIGKIVSLDDETKSQSCMDFTRILVKTKYFAVLNKIMNVAINYNFIVLKW